MKGFAMFSGYHRILLALLMVLSVTTSAWSVNMTLQQTASGSASGVTPPAGLNWVYFAHHTHTTYSDGRDTVQNRILEAANFGADIVSICDHNTIQQCNDPWFIEQDGCVPMRGDEWGGMGRGHACVLNMTGDDPLDVKPDGSWYSVYEMIPLMLARGGTIFINHPFDDGNPWPQAFAPAGIRGVGVWTSVSPNADARGWWSSHISAGRMLVGIGESDHHLEKVLSTEISNSLVPCNYVLAASKQPTDIQAAVEAGRIAVAGSQGAARTFVWCDQNGDGVYETPMGTNIEVAQPKRLRFRVEVYGGALLGNVMVYSRNGGVKISSVNGSPCWRVDYETDVTAATKDYIRSELRDTFGIFQSFSNPIYINHGLTCVVSGPPSPTDSAPIVFTLTFKEAVTGLAAASVHVTNGTKGLLSGSGNAYTLQVMPLEQGVVTCRVPGNIAWDGVGNGNMESNLASVVFDTIEGEGEVPVEGEGEIVVEGEGEVPVEGEGELACTVGTPYAQDDPCYVEVVTGDPYCCYNEWDGTCQSAYDTCIAPEGEVLSEGEGEVLPEGEGEVLPEGEGEVLPEGEGEVLPEGEGEVLPEGEGEVLPEGEGEVLPEGEGEILPEGEGEVLPEGEGEVLPEGEGEVLPEGEGEVLPEGEGEVLPEGEGEVLPEGEGEVLPEGEGEVLPEGEGEVLPEGEGEVLPEGEGEVLPEGEGEVLPEGEGEVMSEGEGEVLPEGEGEVLPEGEGEVLPEGEGEILPEGEGEVLPEGEGEVLPEGEGEVLPEGEGEVLPEGEGEVLPEGEGEVLPEGEGEVLSEGEGEVLSEGEGEVMPEGEGEVLPEGEGEVLPEGEGEVLPEGEGEVLPEGEGEVLPEGEGEILPEGEGEILPEGEGEVLPEGEGEVLPEGEGEVLPEGEGEVLPEGEGEVLPEGEGEVLPEGEGEVLPEGEGEVLPEGEGEILPEGEGEVLPEGEGEVLAEGEGEVLPEGEGEVLPEGEGEILPEGEGEVLPEGEGEVLSEGEGEVLPEGEGEQEACGCCSRNQKTLNLKGMFERTMGDWLLIGLSTLALVALVRTQK